MARQPMKKAENDDVSENDMPEKDTAASQAVSDMLVHLERLRADLADLSERVADIGDEKIRAGAETLRAEGKRAARKASSMVNDIADQSEDMIAQADKFSRERPVLAMGMAATAGFLLAMIMSRR